MTATPAAPLSPAAAEALRKKRLRQAAQLLVGGAASAAVGNSIISAEDGGALKDMSAIGRGLERNLGSNPSTDQMSHVIRSYAEAGDRALDTKVFGVPGREVIETIRSAPFMPASNRWKGRDSANHYDAFGRGPLYGYLQFMAERVGGDGPRKRPLFELANPENVPGFMRGIVKRVNEQRRNRFIEDLMDKTNDVANEVAGFDAVVQRPSEHITHTLAANNQPTLTVDQQRKVLDRMGNSAEFTKWSPFFRKKYDETLRKSYHGTYKGFKGYGDTIGGPFITARKALIGGGLALGAAGVGIGIHQWLKSRRAKREAEKRLANRMPAV